MLNQPNTSVAIKEMATPKAFLSLAVCINPSTHKMVISVVTTINNMAGFLLLYHLALFSTSSI
jgi:hypothetical protein